MSRVKSRISDDKKLVKVYEKDHTWLMKNRGAYNLHDEIHMILSWYKRCQKIPGFPQLSDDGSIELWADGIEKLVGGQE